MRATTGHANTAWLCGVRNTVFCKGSFPTEALSVLQPKMNCEPMSRLSLDTYATRLLPCCIGLKIVSFQSTHSNLHAPNTISLSEHDPNICSNYWLTDQHTWPNNKLNVFTWQHVSKKSNNGTVKSSIVFK